MVCDGYLVGLWRGHSGDGLSGGGHGGSWDVDGLIGIELLARRWIERRF
jgi:hypothetical protein